ncbi:gamma-glutamylcyclotransferase family protein [Robbsia sp. KACC 23696]|uniref:gamma-glutamylcyclotransferase family protein n=1 Tax=Robbsia sp. KACC 23696 TaxID=3149231 RepID=UPI00325A8807
MSLSPSSSIETCDVFVYGTLRHGEINDIALAAMRFGRPDLPAPRHVAVGRVRGHLVDFGDWPGLVPPHGADAAGKTARCATVRGDVFRIDRALLSILDEIEGIRPDGRGAFYRSEIDVIPDRPARADGSDAHAAVPAEAPRQALRCVYYPIDPEAGRGRPPISGGDWIVHRLARCR